MNCLPNVISPTNSRSAIQSARDVFRYAAQQQGLGLGRAPAVYGAHRPSSLSVVPSNVHSHLVATSHAEEGLENMPKLSAPKHSPSRSPESSTESPGKPTPSAISSDVFSALNYMQQTGRLRELQYTVQADLMHAHQPTFVATCTAHLQDGTPLATRSSERSKQSARTAAALQMHNALSALQQQQQLTTELAGRSHASSPAAAAAGTHAANPSSSKPAISELQECFQSGQLSAPPLYSFSGLPTGPFTASCEVTTRGGGRLVAEGADDNKQGAKMKAAAQILKDLAVNNTTASPAGAARMSMPQAASPSPGKSAISELQECFQSGQLSASPLYSVIGRGTPVSGLPTGPFTVTCRVVVNGVTLSTEGTHHKMKGAKTAAAALMLVKLLPLEGPAACNPSTSLHATAAAAGGGSSAGTCVREGLEEVAAQSPQPGRNASNAPLSSSVEGPGSGSGPGSTLGTDGGSGWYDPTPQGGSQRGVAASNAADSHDAADSFYAGSSDTHAYDHSSGIGYGASTSRLVSRMDEVMSSIRPGSSGSDPGSTAGSSGSVPVPMSMEQLMFSVHELLVDLKASLTGSPLTPPSLQQQQQQQQMQEQRLHQPPQQVSPAVQSQGAASFPHDAPPPTPVLPLAEVAMAADARAAAPAAEGATQAEKTPQSSSAESVEAMRFLEPGGSGSSSPLRISSSAFKLRMGEELPAGTDASRDCLSASKAPPSGNASPDCRSGSDAPQGSHVGRVVQQQEQKDVQRAYDDFRAASQQTFLYALLDDWLTKTLGRGDAEAGGACLIEIGGGQYTEGQIRKALERIKNSVTAEAPMQFLFTVMLEDPSGKGRITRSSPKCGTATGAVLAALHAILATVIDDARDT